MPSARLQAIINMVPGVETIADIGCDHGKAAVSLLVCNKAKRAICSDISAKSLKKAEKLVSMHKLVDRVSLRRGDGLEVIEAGEADAALLSGMGGELIADILDRGKGKLPDTLILSCNSKPEVLRAWLCGNGYRIEDEDIVCENRRFYPVMLAKRGYSAKLSDMELELGPLLIENKHPVLRRLLERKIKKLRQNGNEIRVSDSPQKNDLLHNIDLKIKNYSEVLKCL